MRDVRSVAIGKCRDAVSSVKLNMCPPSASSSVVSTITWTHPSVSGLLHESGGVDPYEAIVERARTLALKAMEGGWSGPPYDPFELAEFVGVDVVARQNLEDARLVSVDAGTPSRIEFNPNRRPARVRFCAMLRLLSF
jgi:hypothetical protein